MLPSTCLSCLLLCAKLLLRWALGGPGSHPPLEVQLGVAMNLMEPIGVMRFGGPGLLGVWTAGWGEVHWHTQLQYLLLLVQVHQLGLVQD